jgi:hypothetical protein
MDRSLGAVWRRIGRMGGIGRILNPVPKTPVGRMGLTDVE